MGTDQPQLTGADFGRGVPLSEIPDGGMLNGHADGTPVLLARRGDELFALSSTCTHYGGPLAEGLMVGDTVRCPWHHACFSLRTGEALAAPALNPLTRWNVQRRGETVVVQGELAPAETRRTLPAKQPASIVIVGGGGAGDAAADMLRRLGYAGELTVISADDSAPYDRPNLSKDYLAGNAPEDWIPLRPSDFYSQRDIELVVGTRVASIDRQNRAVILEDGSRRGYDALLLATGASPIRLPKTVDRGDLSYLRSLADSRALVARAERATTAVVIGASFIGLEVAASLRARKLTVHVVAPEARPLERVMGRALSDFIRGLHESNGVQFHLGRTAAAIEEGSVTLDDGERIACDLAVAGIGVRPNDELASSAGLTVEKGIVVNEYLETSQSGIFAAGDVARYPDPRGSAGAGGRIRIEHWVVAQRQGQAAARNLLGLREPFDDVPFFWSRHYESSISYVGHAEQWDEEHVSGNVNDGDCTVTYRAGGRTLAVATVGRDHASLEAERALERVGAEVA